MLTIFNVGQGDGCLLHPKADCVFSDAPLLIDAGPRKACVFKHMHGVPRYRLLVTHSHRDHLGGVPALLKHCPPEHIFLPYWLPEIDRIYAYLRKHMPGTIHPIAWKRLTKVPFALVAQGDELCGHATILNPPKQPDSVFATLHFGQRKIDDRAPVAPPSDMRGETLPALRSALEMLGERGIPLPREDIENYRSPVLTTNSEPFSTGVPENYGDAARRFVHLFFITLGRLSASSAATRIEYDAARLLELTSNQVSIILRYALHGNTFLLTGDADTFVFERLMSQKVSLSAGILKVPHHGSRENLSARVLTAISPDHAIISHDNGKFGRSRDTHPHHEVIDLLDLHGIESHYTNAVIKQGKRIKAAAGGQILGGLVQFA